MRKWIDAIRYSLLALILAIFSPRALAQSTSSSAGEAAAGDPTLGVIIIAGLIGFFVVLAWLISRMGDDGGRGPDHTML